MAHLFLKYVVTNHGMPERITSDRDKLFTSNFWTSLTNLMGIDHRLTTAYHPQGNGQTERTNQMVEQYLRHYTSYEQDDWDELLPLAQFAFNNATHSTIKETPFYANYGYHPKMFGEPRKHESTSEAAITTVENLKKLHKHLKNDIDFANLRAATYYNQRHGKGPTLKRGEKVFLLRRNIKTKRPSQKLDHQKIGPFTIEEQTGPVNYRLKLPASMKRIHPVFHTSLLEPAPDNAETAEDIEIESDENEYEVEQILDHKRPFYLVKWKGYDTSENTWEPIANLTGCRQKMKEYHQRRIDRNHSRRKGSSSSETN